LTVAPVDQSLAGMPQVVKPETQHPGAAPGTVERLPYGVATHRATVAADEHPILTCPARHVLDQDRSTCGGITTVRLPASVLGSASKATGDSSSSTRCDAL